MNTTTARRRSSQEEERFFVASQWQLTWWKFRKHRLAMTALPLLLAFYVVALFAEFISPYQPVTRFADYPNAPPQRIRFVDGSGQLSLRPFVYALEQYRDPETLRITYEAARDQKIPILFFTKGEPYKLWGVFECEAHLFGTQGGPVFLFGTDRLGRDLFTRIIYASRTSLTIGLVGILLSLLLGMILGGISGYFGGTVDVLVQRLIDLIRSLPSIPLWMGLAAALPRDWSTVKLYFGMVIVLSFIGWTDLARVIRGKLLSLREEDFVMAARLAGQRDFRIITSHLIPSFMSYIIVSVSLAVPRMILAETALSFIGLGLQPPAVSWGVLLQDAQKIRAVAHQPWLVLIPCCFVVVTVLLFNFLGDGLRGAADPYK